MLGILDSILCAIEELAASIIGLLVVMLNALIAGIGAFLGVLVALLPVMPSPPSPPENGVLAVINFIVPLAPLATLLVTMGSLFVGFIVVRMALNWVKAL